MFWLTEMFGENLQAEYAKRTLISGDCVSPYLGDLIEQCYVLDSGVVKIRKTRDRAKRTRGEVTSFTPEPL